MITWPFNNHHLHQRRFTNSPIIYDLWVVQSPVSLFISIPDRTHHFLLTEYEHLDLEVMQHTTPGGRDCSLSRCGRAGCRLGGRTEKASGEQRDDRGAGLADI